MKLVRVVSIRFDCDAKPPRLAQETLATYTTRLQKMLRWHLHRATLTALDAIAKDISEHEARAADVTFVTAPGFYWGTPWRALRNVCELRELPVLQIDPVRRCVAKVAAQFAPERYGKLLFLAGGAALLFETARADEIDGASVRADPLFEPLNYQYAATNFLMPADGHHTDADLPLAVSWPKSWSTRHTSSIDYGIHERGFDTPHTSTFRLADGTRIDVPDAARAEPQPHGFGARMQDLFDNRLDGMPAFGVDLCVDFDAHAERPPSLDTPHHSIDFVLTGGVDLDTHRFDPPRSLRYVAHNDGRRHKYTAVFAIDRDGRLRHRLPDAPAARHLTPGERNHVSIHEFTLDADASRHVPFDKA